MSIKEAWFHALPLMVCHSCRPIHVVRIRYRDILYSTYRVEVESGISLFEIKTSPDRVQPWAPARRAAPIVAPGTNRSWMRRDFRVTCPVSTNSITRCAICRDMNLVSG